MPVSGNDPSPAFVAGHASAASSPPDKMGLIAGNKLYLWDAAPDTLNPSATPT
jgi:hypothetical protein